MTAPSVHPILAGLLAMALAGGSASAHAAASLPVDQILARNAAARGGAEAWQHVTALTLRGRIDANRPRALRPDYRPPVARTSGAPAAKSGTDDAHRVVELPYRLEMQRPHETRLEIDVNGQTAVQVYDGVQGAKIRPFTGRAAAEPYSAEELALAADEPALDGMLLGAVRAGARVTLEGEDPVDGAPAYRLRVAQKDGSARHVWVDERTFLDVRFDGSRRLDGKTRTIETSLKDYRAFNGLMIPTLTETVVPGVPGATRIHVDAVEVNPTLAADRFRVPLPTAAAARANP